MLKDT
jgi:hypothetical protein